MFNKKQPDVKDQGKQIRKDLKGNQRDLERDIRDLDRGNLLQESGCFFFFFWKKVLNFLVELLSSLCLG